MPRMKTEDLDWFLQQPIIGVLATLRRDGRPYTVPVWWLWHEGSLWLSGTYERVWCKQLARDPRASLCIETMPALLGTTAPGDGARSSTPSPVPGEGGAQAPGEGSGRVRVVPGEGFAGHAEFDGPVTRRELPAFDIWPISRLLVEKYVGLGDPGRAPAVESFFANMQTEHRLLLELVPEVRRAIDMRVYRGKRADREYQAERSDGKNDTMK
ncbi:MAG: hypothetical protein QOD06_115 [Candidatus Binatota bacterium]|nr:hypothetical protein [Candidatus Binatota bacterium]